MTNFATIYLNLEDDVAKIVTRIKREKASEITLVCPKRSFLFNDSINLRLLKKQVDILGKSVSILTMDERGQLYAKEAGFKLKFLPKSTGGNSAFSDIKRPVKKSVITNVPAQEEPRRESILERAAESIHSITSAVKNMASPKVSVSQEKDHLDDIPDEPRDYIQSINQEPQLGLVEVVEPVKIRTERPPYKLFVAFVVISLIIALVVVLFVLPKAEVTVYAKSEPLSREIDINFATAITEVNLSKLHVPALKVGEVIESTEKFQSQGKRDVGNKANGNVIIYNFTRSPINLKASTTTFVLGNKTYTLIQDISGYRPTTYSNERTREINTSSLGSPVEIVATQGGEGYNVPEGTRIEITNQVFGSNPQFLYAKTVAPISGGTSRFLSYISEQDVANAQSSLKAKLVSEYRKKLEQEGLLLLDNAFVADTLDYNYEKPVGTETPSFVATLKIRVTGIVIEKSVIEGLIRERMKQTLASNRTLDGDESEIVYKVNNVDFNNELGSLTASFQGKSVLNIDLEGIEPELAGKTQEQVNDILTQRAEIDRVDITLAPSWQSVMPWMKDKIKIRIID